MRQLLEVSLDSPTCAPAPWKGLWSGPRKHLKVAPASISFPAGNLRATLSHPTTSHTHLMKRVHRV